VNAHAPLDGLAMVVFGAAQFSQGGGHLLGPEATGQGLKQGVDVLAAS
jgi:hypothetical protein